MIAGIIQKYSTVGIIPPDDHVTLIFPEWTAPNVWVGIKEVIPDGGDTELDGNGAEIENPFNSAFSATFTFTGGGGVGQCRLWKSDVEDGNPVWRLVTTTYFVI